MTKKTLNKILKIINNTYKKIFYQYRIKIRNYLIERLKTLLKNYFFTKKNSNF